VQLGDLRQQVTDFDTLSHPERIKLFAWFLHSQESRERVDAEAIRRCYDKLHLKPPNVSRDLARLAGRTPPELLRDATGYRLEARVRADFEAKYGDLQSSIAVAKLLAELPSKIPSLDESNFLREALSCYKVRAFRATIVMVWNLAFDHLLRWLLADTARLQTFNARIGTRYQRKKDIKITAFEDFEELKESEIIEIASSAGLLTGGITKVLREKLDRRNMAAHPSSVVVLQYQADDAISDLAHNVVLRLQ